MTKTRVLAGVVLGVMVLAGGCRQTGAPPDKRIQDAKGVVVDLRKTFEGGKLFDGDPRQDMRMVLVIGILKKVHYGTIKNEKSETRKRVILAGIDEAIKTFEDVAPKWQQAVDARKTEAAKDLIPYMQKLETQLDQLTATLQGRAP
jgi:hypothetical protein